MSQDTLNHGPGPGESVHPADAVTEQFAAITENQLKDGTDQSANDRMREDRVRQNTAVADARTAVEGAVPRPVPGERGMRDLGRTEAPRPSAHPDAQTGPMPRLDRGNTAPQPVLDRATEAPMLRPAQDGQTGPMPVLPPNREPRNQDVSGAPGYQGKHRGGADFEPQYPLADTQYKGEHRKTLMGRVRNVLNRLRGRG